MISEIEKYPYNYKTMNSEFKKYDRTNHCNSIEFMRQIAPPHPRSIYDFIKVNRKYTLELYKNSFKNPLNMESFGISLMLIKIFSKHCCSNSNFNNINKNRKKSFQFYKYTNNIYM